MRHKMIFLSALLAVAALVTLGVVIGLETSVQAAPDPTPTLGPIPDPVLGEFDPAAVAEIDLTTLPVIPEIGEFAQRVYQDGIQRGNNPHAFITVGDCMTDDPAFLRPVGEENFDLGEYADLEPVIAYFVDDDLNAFARKSQAAAGGFNSASVIDSMWANPEYCEKGETPLTCEFRIVQPSIALIMFGTNDVYYLDEGQFDFFLRSIIVETVRNGTLPVLSTFPVRPDFPDKSVLYNQIVARVAQDYDIPLINLWLALESLPNQGVDPEDATHMTGPEGSSAAYFTAENLQTGFAVRNLVTLQTLDAVLQAVSQE